VCVCACACAHMRASQQNAQTSHLHGTALVCDKQTAERRQRTLSGSLPGCPYGVNPCGRRSGRLKVGDQPPHAHPSVPALGKNTVTNQPNQYSRLALHPYLVPSCSLTPAPFLFISPSPSHLESGIWEEPQRVPGQLWHRQLQLQNQSRGAMAREQGVRARVCVLGAGLHAAKSAKAKHADRGRGQPGGWWRCTGPVLETPALIGRAQANACSRAHVLAMLIRTTHAHTTTHQSTRVRTHTCTHMHAHAHTHTYTHRSMLVCARAQWQQKARIGGLGLPVGPWSSRTACPTAQPAQAGLTGRGWRACTAAE